MDNKLGMIKTDFLVGETIDRAYERLHEKSNLFKRDVYGEFNGNIIDSTMTIDEVYKLITGSTKAEFNKKEKEWRDEYDRKEREHKASIPEKTKEYLKEGHTILDKSVWEKWDKIVPIRLGDLYHGMELDCTLKLVKMLDIDKCEMNDAVEVFKKQGHSGMSAGLMFSMMRTFCKRGNEFVQASK